MNDEPIKPRVKRTITVTTSETWTVTIRHAASDRAEAELEKDRIDGVDEVAEPTLDNRSEDILNQEE